MNPDPLKQAIAFRLSSLFAFIDALRKSADKGDEMSKLVRSELEKRLMGESSKSKRPKTNGRKTGSSRRTK